MKSLAFRMAAREARASRGKFLFVICAVAAGVGALTGVRGFSLAFRSALLREARTLMAADLSVRTFAPASPPQQSVLDDLTAHDVAITQVIETVSMMSHPSALYPVMVSIKAVDPTRYPFYGEVQLEPAEPLPSALGPDRIAVSDDLLLRLGVQPGQAVKIGGAEFQIHGVVRMEPDRMTGTLNVGPRVMMTPEGLERTGLIRFGSRASHRYLLRLGPAAPAVADVRRRLERAFRSGARIADFRETHPVITQGLNRSTIFLSLVSLIALVVGGLGVASAMHSHLQQHMDSIGILKCLGARSGQIIRIYVVQALGLGLAGSALGLLLGYGVQAAFPRLISGYFTLPVRILWTSPAALEGLGVGMLATVLFTLPPLLHIRRIRPADVFRREMPESRPAWRRRLGAALPSLGSGAVILLGLGGIAAWLAGSTRVGLYFLGGVVCSLIALAAVAWLLLRLLRVAPRLIPWRLPTAWRHGIANLHRPGAHATAVLVALGIGVTFTLTVYLIQRSLLVDIVRSAPPDAPNVFFLNVTDKERTGVMDVLQAQPGVQDAPAPVPAISGRIVRVDNRPTEQLGLQGWSRRFLDGRYVTYSERLHKNARILEGTWEKAKAGMIEVAVDEDAARALGVHPGAILDWQFGQRRVSARVAAVFRGEIGRAGANLEFVFSPGALDGLPAVYFLTARVRPRDVPLLQKAMFDRYPTVTVINAAEVLQIVQQVVDNVALVVRFIAAFSILGGVIILAAAVAGTRFRRMREVTILKTLGATRARVIRIFSVEFLIVGVVAGTMGCLLATGLSRVFLRRLLESDLLGHWPAYVVAVAATALLANFAGWTVSFRLLGQKPLEILRQE